MGVFSINESHYNLGPLPEVEMNEDYTTGTDMAIALVEARENEFAVLDAGIKQDMLAAMCEDYDERLAINEATASGVLAKVKEILKKLLEKLKSIFHAFMAKMNSFFGDSYEFFKKYSAEIAAKSLTDFKIKARKFDVGKFEGLINYKDTAFTFGITTKNSKNIIDAEQNKTRWATMTQDEIDKKMDSDNLGKDVLAMVFQSKALSAMSIEENLSNIATEVEDYLFEDSEEMENLNGSSIVTDDWIGGLLSKKNFIENISKVNQSVERVLNKLITEIGKDITGVAGTIGTDKTYKTKSHAVTLSGDAKTKSTYVTGDRGYDVTTSTSKESKDGLIKYVAYQQAKATKFQDCMIKAQNARLSCAKKAVAQAKKIFAAAVAYNPKKESYELYTAVGESAEFEAMMAME